MSTVRTSLSLLLPNAETLTVEFKSDRTHLSDTDLVEALVCLANTDGGELWLGVEDDGTPTGLHAAHHNLAGLSAMVAAKTSPSLAVTVHTLELSGISVAQIVLPKSNTIVATSAGVYMRRRLKQDGTLEQLVEAGLVQPHGNTRNRSYTLSAELYRAKGKQVAYTRQAGFSNLQHQQMVLSHVQHHGRIQRSEVIELCHLTGDQAAKLLKRLKNEGRLTKHGERRWAFYTLSEISRYAPL